MPGGLWSHSAETHCVLIWSKTLNIILIVIWYKSPRHTLFVSEYPHLYDSPGDPSCRVRATTRPRVSTGQAGVGTQHLVLPAHYGSILPRPSVVYPAARDGAVHQPFLQVLPLWRVRRRPQGQVRPLCCFRFNMQAHIRYCSILIWSRFVLKLKLSQQSFLTCFIYYVFLWSFLSSSLV